MPDEVQFLGRVRVYLFWNFRIRVHLWLLLVEVTFESVSVLEVPGTPAHWLIVLKVSFPVEAVRIDPLPGLHLALFPRADQFHACFLKHIGAVALLLAEAPPARINITGLLIGEDTLSVTLTIFPVTMVLTDVVVDHLADAVS